MCYRTGNYFLCFPALRSKINQQKNINYFFFIKKEEGRRGVQEVTMPIWMQRLNGKGETLEARNRTPNLISPPTTTPPSCLPSQHALVYLPSMQPDFMAAPPDVTAESPNFDVCDLLFQRRWILRGGFKRHKRVSEYDGGLWSVNATLSLGRFCWAIPSIVWNVHCGFWGWGVGVGAEGWKGRGLGSGEEGRGNLEYFEVKFHLLSVSM